MWFRVAAKHLLRSLKDVRLHFVLTSITTATIAVSVFIFAFFILSVTNLRDIITSLSRDVRINIYLKDNASRDAIDAIVRTVSPIKVVRSVVFVTKSEALEQFRASLKDKDILNGLDDNPLPQSIRVYLKKDASNIASVRKIKGILASYAAIDSIEAGEEWLENFSRSLSFFTVGVVVTGGLMAIALIFIVSNTLRLAVMYRIDEIGVMKYLGATKGYIIAPFYIVAVLESVVSAGAALGSLWLLFSAFSERVESSLSAFFAGVTIGFLSPVMIAGIALFGIVTGLIGAYLSLRKVV